MTRAGPADAPGHLRRIRSELLARPEPALDAAAHLTRAIDALEGPSCAAAHIDDAVGELPAGDPLLVQLAALAVLCTMEP